MALYNHPNRNVFNVLSTTELLWHLSNFNAFWLLLRSCPATLAVIVAQMHRVRPSSLVRRDGPVSQSKMPIHPLGPTKRAVAQSVFTGSCIKKKSTFNSCDLFVRSLEALKLFLGQTKVHFFVVANEPSEFGQLCILRTHTS
jgi:hypothetical protein